MPFIGDEYVTTKEYQALRQRWRESGTTKPWKRWATHELSPAGQRDREIVQAQTQAEARRQKAVSDGIRDQRRTMDEETKAAGLDPVRQEKVARLLHRANECDWETGGDYSVRAVQAQRQLRELGVDLTPTTQGA